MEKPESKADGAEETRPRRLVISLAIYVVLALAAGWYFYHHRQNFSRMLDFHPAHLALLLLLHLLTRLLLGLRLKFLVSSFKVDMGVAEGAGLSLMQGYGNALTIKGGTVGLAYYLFKQKNFGIDRFTVITGGGFVITALTLGVAGLAGTGYLASGAETVRPEIPLLFGLITAVALGIILLPRLRLRMGRIGRFVTAVFEGWNVLKADRSNITRLILLEICILATFAARYWVVFRTFGQPIELVGAFLLAPPAYLTQMANFTPLGVGLREPLLAYISGILGHTVQGGLGAAVVDSVFLLAVALVGGPIASSILAGKHGKKNAKA